MVNIMLRSLFFMMLKCTAFGKGGEVIWLGYESAVTNIEFTGV